jgi:tetratricopeptide (TPR) repeat protein
MNNSRTQLLSEIRTRDLSKIEAAIEEASQRGSISDEAIFVRFRGSHFLRKGLIAEAIADAERAIDFAKAAKDDEVLGMALGLKAEIFATQSNPEAEPLFQQAIELSVASGDLASESTTRLQYGNLLIKEGAPADALVQFEKAMASGEAAGQVSLRISPAIGIGLVYFNAGEYHRAIDIWESTITPARENHQDAHLLTAVMNIAEAYLELKDIEQAERYANEAFELAKKSNNLDRQASCHKLLASIHHTRGNFDLAIE